MAKLGALVAVALLAAGLAGCGGGAKLSPRAELSKFVVDYVDHNRDNCCETGMHATVDRITFARSDSRWALVRIAVTDFTGQPDGDNYLVVREGNKTWHVIGYGHGAMGCLIPVRIGEELAKAAPKGMMSCPAGG